MGEAVLTATVAKLSAALLVLAFSLCFGIWYRKKMSDKVDGEPLLAEEALVHAKSDYIRQYHLIDHSFYVIHFYIAARDEVVTCDVPYEVWRNVEMKSRGTLTHQGGKFYSFETQGVMYIGGGEYVRN